MSPYAQVVADYIAGVMSGEIVAGRLVKLAVQRHVDDLDHGYERGLYFDESIATEACDFFPAVLRHSKEQWANQPYVLAPWQAFIVASVMGWRREQDGFRRFREVYATVARKNGKSTMMAGLSCLLLYADNPLSEGGEFYVSATKEDQACIIFREAQSMVEKSPSLSRLSTVVKKNIAYPAHGSFMRPLGSDSKTNAGWNPSGMMIDELCDWQEHHRKLFGVLTTGSGSRDQPLRVVACTAGDETSELWQAEDDYAVKVVDGTITDDRYFAFIARLDEERACQECHGKGCDGCVKGRIPADNPYDPKNFAKSNPNIGVSVKEEDLIAVSLKAQKMKSFTNDYLRFNMNIRVSSTYKCIDTTGPGWKAGNVPLSDWRHNVAYGAFDLGWKDDLASIAIVTKFFEGQDEHHNDRWRYEARSWSFICEDGKKDLAREPWASMIADGCLTVTPGNVTDIPGAFKRKLLEVTKEYNVIQWAHDNTGALMLAIELQEENGVECFPFAQTHGMYTPAFKLYLNLIEDGMFIHGGDLLINWTASHLVANQDHREKIMPDKKKSKEKIDPQTSTIMAIGGAMKGVESTSWQPWMGVQL